MTPSEWLLSQFEAKLRHRDNPYSLQDLEESIYTRHLFQIMDDNYGFAKYRWKPGTPHPQLPEVVH